MGTLGAQKQLPADLILLYFGIPEKAGVLAKSRNTELFHFNIQALWVHQVSFGPGKILAEQRIKLTLGNFFPLGPGN